MPPDPAQPVGDVAPDVAVGDAPHPTTRRGDPRDQDDAEPHAEDLHEERPDHPGGEEERAHRRPHELVGGQESRL